MIGRVLVTVALLACSTPAFAQDGGGEEPRFCPNRPSLGASGCTTLPGQVHVEFSGVDWQRDNNSDTREDTLLFGDVFARIGITPHAELQIGWTPLGSVRTLDKATGRVSRQSGTGDVRLGFRRSLSHPDGEGLSTALEPFVTLPVGSKALSDGDWSAGLGVPVYWQMNEKWSLSFTGEAAAAVDEDGTGRHFDTTGVFGVGYSLTDAISATVEFSVERDNDPAGHVTRTLAAGSIGWQPTDRTQIDLLFVHGLNRDAPDTQLVVGGAVLF